MQSIVVIMGLVSDGSLCVKQTGERENGCQDGEMDLGAYCDKSGNR